jgi:hypothetical protein
MKEVNETVLPQLRLQLQQQQLPQQLYIHSQYVDDGDFYNTNNMELNLLETILPTICLKYNLQLNISKTERYQITKLNSVQTIYPDDRQQYKQLNIRKLGSYVKQESDLHMRLQAVITAYKNLNSLWFRPYALNLKHRMRLYNIYILPLLRYNLGTAAYTQAQMNKLDACHRRQLRKILQLFYPNTIHNKQLYNKTNHSPISLIALEQRWKLFGHILRSPSTTPANLIMEQYYKINNFYQQGRPKLTLATMLDNDVKFLPPSPTHYIYRLNNITWYNYYKSLANNREQWQEFTKQIIISHNKQQDVMRHINENKRQVPTSQQLSQHYNEYQRKNNPHDLSTPPGMDYRNNKRSPSYSLPRRTKVKRIRLTFLSFTTPARQIREEEDHLAMEID